MPSQFQNTIAYGQFVNSLSSTITLVADDWTDIPTYLKYVDTDINTELTKNVIETNTNDCSVKFQQLGTYFVDFSFVAIGGDGRNYYLKHQINGSDPTYTPIVKFYQQATDQSYEVSTNFLIEIRKGDVLNFQIKAPFLSTTTFKLQYFKLLTYSLQPLGFK